MTTVTVLVTRPARQSDGLLTALTEAGIASRSLPMLDLHAVNDLQSVKSVKSQIQALARQDLAIFISSNAVNYTAAFVQEHALSWPSELPCIPIGAATAEAIKGQAWHLLDTADKYPIELPADNVKPQTSETLLASPALASVEGKRISIFRGRGGRQLLASELQTRGAKVEYCELYERAYPDYDRDTLGRAIGNTADNKVAAILFASGETLDNFYQHICRYQWQTQLLLIPVVVPSQRLKLRAEQYGFSQIIVSANASSEGFVAAIREELLPAL